MKKFIAHLLLVMFVFALHIGAINVGAIPAEDQTEEVLVEILEASEADFLEFNINSTLHVPDRFFSKIEMAAMEEYFIAALDMKGAPIYLDEEIHGSGSQGIKSEKKPAENQIYIEKQEDNGYHQIMITYVEENERVTVVKLYTAQLKEITESYIIIDMVQNKGYKDIGATIQNHQMLLNAYGDLYESMVSVTAVQEGKLTNEQSLKWIEKLISVADANPIEETVQADYTSATLYTPRIANGLDYNHKRVNLQLATRYNDYEGKTYLWIGTPLITNTY